MFDAIKCGGIMAIILGIDGGALTGMGRGRGSIGTGSISLSSVSGSISENWSLTELVEVSLIFLLFVGGSTELVDGVVCTDEGAAWQPFADDVDPILNCGILLPEKCGIWYMGCIGGRPALIGCP